MKIPLNTVLHMEHFVAFGECEHQELINLISTQMTPAGSQGQPIPRHPAAREAQPARSAEPVVMHQHPPSQAQPLGKILWITWGTNRVDTCSCFVKQNANN